MATMSDERLLAIREFWDGHEDGDVSDDRAVWRFVHQTSLALLDEVDRLRARNAELVEVLRMCDESDETFHHCPVCGWSGGHAPDCELNAVLREASDGAE